MNKLSVVREAAKKIGCTFKVDSTCRINNATAYVLVDRKSGLVLRRNLTLRSAFDTVCNEGF